MAVTFLDGELEGAHPNQKGKESKRARPGPRWPYHRFQHEPWPLLQHGARPDRELGARGALPSHAFLLGGASQPLLVLCREFVMFCCFEMRLCCLF